MEKAMSSNNFRIKNTDKCIRKAVDMQQQSRLPSNFSYKMMEKINGKILLEEKRSEKRTFAAIIITSLLMLAACILVIIKYTSVTLADITHKIPTTSIPSETLFYLPMLIALPLLFGFNYWLRKKYGYLIKH